jgi:hypothetical protein
LFLLIKVYLSFELCNLVIPLLLPYYVFLVQLDHRVGELRDFLGQFNVVLVDELDVLHPHVVLFLGNGFVMAL